MKRQKNYRQLRGKSLARNRLNEIKSRAATPEIRFSETQFQAINNSLFDTVAENPAYGEPPEDRFTNAPLPEFQFDWDEEFFGSATTGNDGLTEKFSSDFPPAGEAPVTSEKAEMTPDESRVIPEETAAGNNTEPGETTITVTFETEPEPQSTVTVTPTQVRFVSVKRQKALAAREAEKLRKPAKRGGTPENKPEARNPSRNPAVFSNTVVTKTDLPAGNKGRGTLFGFAAKTSQNIAGESFRIKSSGQKPEKGISGVEKPSEAPSLIVRRAPSFRSFVISTIHRLMEEQRFLALERESSRLLAREPGTGTKEEPANSETSIPEKSETGFTRWNNPLATAASGGLMRGKNRPGNNNTLPTEKQPATRSSLVRGKPKPAPGSYELNAARITLMEARINAKAISGNMRMKW